MGKDKTWTYSRSSTQIQNDLSILDEEKKKIESVISNFEAISSQISEINKSVESAWKGAPATSLKKGLIKQRQSIETLKEAYQEIKKSIDKRISSQTKELERARKMEQKMDEILKSIKKYMNYFNK